MRGEDGGCISGDWKALSEATCGAPGGHAPGRDFLDVRVTVACLGVRFRVTVTETRGHTQGHDKIYGRCEVVGDSVLLDAALADAVTRARKAEIEIRCLTRAIGEARDAAIAALLQEEKNGESAASRYQAGHADADNGIGIIH